jgi:hypothetical protein
MGFEAGKCSIDPSSPPRGRRRAKGPPGNFSLCAKAGRLERSHHLARLELEILEFLVLKIGIISGMPPPDQPLFGAVEEPIKSSAW